MHSCNLALFSFIFARKETKNARAVGPYEKYFGEIYLQERRNRANNLLLELTDVESQLLALKNVSVSTTGLTRAGRQAGVETAGSELVVESGVDLGLSLATLDLALDVVGAGLGDLLGLGLE